MTLPGVDSGVDSLISLNSLASDKGLVFCESPHNESFIVSKSLQKEFQSIPYSMDTPSEASQSISDVLRSTPTPIPSRRSENRQIGGKIWTLVAHPPNINRNSYSSDIWKYGTEYIEFGKPDSVSSWICNHCNSIILLSRSSTFNVSRHLQKTHKILVKRKREETETIEEREDQETSRKKGFAALVGHVDVERFRELLIRWIVQCQIPFSTMKIE